MYCNLELSCLLTTYRKLCKLNWAFQRTQSKMAENSEIRVIFSAKGGPILIKFRRLVQNDMSTALMCGNGNQM